MRTTSSNIRTALLLSAAIMAAGLTSAGALADTTVTSTLDSSSLGTAGTVTLNGGEVDFSSSGSWDNDFTLTGSGTFALGGYSPTLSGAISGAGTLTVSGAATTDTLTLSGTNSYTGVTTISTATLVLTGSNASSEYDVNTDAVLQIGNDTTAGAISGNVVNSGSVIFNRSNDYVYSGVISGDGTVEISTGRVAFTGTNTYTGDTTIDSGASLFIGNAGTTGAVAGNIVDNGALYFSRTNSYTYAGVISGTGTVEILRGTVYLTGENTYTGTTTIDSRADLYIGAGGTTGAIAGDIVDNGELYFNRSDDITYAGDISGTGDVTITGGGSVTLTGDNSYTGTTEIENGTLIAGSSTALSTGSDYVVDSDGTLDLNDYDITLKSISGSGALALGSGDLTVSTGGRKTFSGAISGSGSVTLSAGVLLLSGDNTYTGTTTISAGTLVLTGSNVSAEYDIASGATLYVGNDTSTGSITGDVVDDGTLIFYRSDDVTYDGAISGDGTVGISGGTVTVTGTNTYTGGTTIYSGATLQLGDGGTTGSITGDVVDYGTLSFNRSDALTFAGDISGTGGVTIDGGGSVTLTGSNSYSGTTTITDGTLIAGSDDALSSASSYDIEAAGTLDLNSYDATIRSISGAGAVTLGSATLTITRGGSFEGVISGTGAVSLSGGTLTLTGTNSYTGGTTIASGAVLQIGDGGTTGSVTGDIVNNGGLIFDRSDAVTFAGDISGTGAMEIDGGGTVTLTGTNSYTGITYVYDGTLTAGGTGALSSASDYVVYSGGTLDLNGYDSTIASLTGYGAVTLGSATLTITDGGDYEGVISGTGGLTLTGGTLILDGVNTYTGTTNIAGGTLVLGSSSGSDATIAGDVTVGDGATLTGYGTVEGSVDNTSGGTVAPGTGGTLTIEGDYTQGADSTLEIAVTRNGASELVVGGTATLDGTLILDFADGSYTGADFTILSANSISGSFATVETTGLSDQYLYGLTYTSDSVSLTATATAAGQIYSDLVTTEIDNAHRLSNMVLAHEPGGDPGVTVWGQAFGGAGSYGSHDGGNAFNQRWAGMLLGLDYVGEDGHSLSVDFTYNQSALGVSGGGKYGEALTNSYGFAVKSAMPFLTFGNLSGDVFYTANDSSIRRTTSLVRAESWPGSKVYGAAMQIDYPFGDLSPLLRLSYAHASRGASEESSEGAAFAVASRTYDSFRGALAVRYRHDFDLSDDMVLTPDATFGVEGEMMGASRKSYVRLSSGTTGWVVPDYAKPGAGALLLSLGLQLKIDDATALYVKADGRDGAHAREGQLSVGGTFRF